MSEIQDDKSKTLVSFFLAKLSAHFRAQGQGQTAPPFFVGLNGVQGAGKTVLVDILKKTMSSPPYNLPTVVFSIDDVYLTHEDQVALAKANPDNPLLQHRGQPSTHDVPLALSVLKGLKEQKPTKIPRYNKAAFSGQGDRVPESEWEEVNTDPRNPIRIVIFEGWCVGFRPLTDEVLAEKHAAAVEALQNSTPENPYDGRLGHNTLKSVTTINNALKKYDEITAYLDVFIHIDALDLQFVYTWRLQQEAGLRATHGSGMTDEEVKHFVDGYYPAYELYTTTLRKGVFQDIKEDWRGNQVRFMVREDRQTEMSLVI